MPRGRPPVDTEAELLHRTIPSGSLLWRVTRREYARRASLFNTRAAPVTSASTQDEIATPYGRFDASDEDTYGFCYAALDDLTAIAETLLRDVAFTEEVRPIPLKDVRGRCLAVYETLEPLTLVTLTTSAELARARQDPWLIQAEPGDYARTRPWGHWLRRCSQAHGFLWPSKRNPGGQSLVLFADRGVGSRLSLIPVFTRDLDGGGGLEWLNRRLEDLNTFVPEPIAPEEERP